MKPALKAEFKKLVSVRSTYVISIIFLLLIGFFAFYVDGFKNAPPATVNPGEIAKAQLFVAGYIVQLSNILSVAGALVGLLLLAHEYRYNTIVYTLTTSNSRSKVLASKILAVFSYAFIFTIVGTAFGLGMIYAGAHAGGHVLPHQQIDYLTFFTKAVFFSEAYALAALLFIALIRNQVGALAALFILPNTLEGLLSLLLKQNSVYMPFTALQQVVQPPVIAGAKAAHDNNTGFLTAPKGALVFGAYLVGAWIVAWYLFLRRDAS